MSKTLRLDASLQHVETHLGEFSLETLASQLPPDLIERTLEETGRESLRVRQLPAVLVTWLVIAMGLFRRLSIPNVYLRLREGFRGVLASQDRARPSRKAFTKARDRLGLEALRRLFETSAEWFTQRFAAVHLWKGLKLLAIDGTTLKAPDSDASRRALGAPGSSRGRTGYPCVRVVGLMAVHTHLLLAAAVGGYNTGELTLVQELLTAISPGSLILLDRGFLSYGWLWGLLQRNSHFLIRGKKGLKVRKRKRLAPGDWLAEALVPRALRKKHPELPEDLDVRVIPYRIPGFRPSYLMTSLLDPQAYPASELVDLYHTRWEQELGWDEMKTHMASAAVPFRSRTPDRVRQEAYGLLVAYNLVRSLMSEAATRQGISPLRLSFVDSLECIERYCPMMALAPGYRLSDLYAELLEEIGACRLPQRRKRCYPRAVKVKMSSYPLNRRHHRA